MATPLGVSLDPHRFVRRTTATTRSAPPTASPPPNGASLEDSPKTTAALFFRKDQQRPPPSSKLDEDTGNSCFQSSRDSVESGRTSTQPSSPLPGPSFLMSERASEAIVDSRGVETLSAEEVEELKKVRK
ncbi:hypothetical protein L226DRAFT_575061 [Lentinus tigrinus ALCF2SS1-7]|uniref:Uncharacterized protein n=1 Tax=Lentinus tigrinus ALCF2SS1-6 TaxID=1328759 RepID=A0A5C2RW02_9APHY|nr:hypothetical protein L227DRAFT_615540 [Lentinus tigrinus ALCF2SS1-6]RPD70159.1 hypothetical protein L226DRAFT_575061 [Lentinus tigrinus ALCF2SS1-7]